MKVVLDFDHVQFDTVAFKDALMNALEPFGVSREEWEQTYRAHKKGYIYFHKDHLSDLAAAYHVPREQLQAAVDRVTQAAGQFLYPDVLPFLDWLRTQGIAVTLLSVGEDELQRAKLKGSRLEEYFPDGVITTKSKEEMVHEVLKSGEPVVILVNDRAQESDAIKRAHPQVTVIQNHRRGGEYEHERAVLADYHTQTLEDVQKVIEKHFAPASA
jgi:beta-phosphoglucomutase-like phosphatase (HAD superfamily)